MSQTASGRRGRTCPGCNSFVPEGNPRCSNCKLEVKKMDAFAAAKRAAFKKGYKEARTGPRELPVLLQPKVIMLALLAAAIIGGGYYLMRPKPPRYAAFPTTSADAVKTMLTYISKGDDADYDKAYGLIADSARDPGASDERGDYMQVFDVMNSYLTGEFGSGWITQTQAIPDANDPDVVTVKVALETLHFTTAQQTTPDKLATYGKRYGVTGTGEFNPGDAAYYRKMAGIFDVLRASGAGQGSIDDLHAIIGARSSNIHQPPMVRKVGLLAVLRNPHGLNWQDVIQAWPMRQDPVVRARLTAMTTDGRYDSSLQEKANEVLQEKVSDEELISVGL